MSYDIVLVSRAKFNNCFFQFTNLAVRSKGIIETIYARLNFVP